MTIDYEQLKLFVKEAMFTGGGINQPSAPEGVPHRMPAADPSQRDGNAKANELYGIALEAREATEKLVVALDDPIFDDAYEYAFKATACLRKTLNALESSGAEPAPEDRVVAPPQWEQPYNAGAPAGLNGSASGAVWPGFLDEANKAPPDVARKHAIIAKVPQIGAADDKIDTRPEFEVDLAKFIQDATDRVKPADITVALARILQQLRAPK
jgi:hypothetical protein|tara:strand:+ start:124 stop:759 length:636 start_codon:yes stop_codon:yes gene_type:complete